MLATVSDQEFRAAQILTLSTLALWLALGFVPALRRYANAIRACLLAFFVVGWAAFLAYAFLR